MRSIYKKRELGRQDDLWVKLYRFQTSTVTISSTEYVGFDVPKLGSTLTERLEKYLGGDFAHLTTDEDENTIQAEYVCSTAGEED